MSDPSPKAQEEPSTPVAIANLKADDDEFSQPSQEDSVFAAEAKPDSLQSQISANRERRYVAYTLKLPSSQLAALQSIWLELKRLYGANSPDKSGMIQQAIEDWLKRWEGPERRALLDQLLEIRQDTRKRQFRK